MRAKKPKKVTVTYSLSEAGAARLEKFVEENCIDKSKLVEKLILNQLKKINNENLGNT